VFPRRRERTSSIGWAVSRRMVSRPAGCTRPARRRRSGPCL
jgi:hypothetical protein